MVTPEILKDLTVGEYILRDYIIPFRGDGEAIAGQPVEVVLPEVGATVCISLYPKWMTAGSYASDWDLWARIEVNFQFRSKDWNYQRSLRELAQNMGQLRENREKFNKLAVAAGMTEMK